MERTPEFGSFSAVDEGDAAALGDYLDAVRGEDGVARWKELSFDLLEARPGGVLVDIGCGLGDDVRSLAGRVAPGGRAIGIDASETMIAEARRRSEGAAGEGTEFLVADATRVPLGDGAADGCRCERVLQHLDEPGPAVAEMARIVRTGGIVVAAEPDWGTLVVDGGDPEVEAVLAAAAMSRVRNPTAGRSLRRLFAAAGLSRVEVIARTLLISDLPRARMLLGIDGALEHAVGGGLVPRRRAEAWRAELDAASGAQRLTAAITSFLAAGRVGGGPG